MIEYSGDVNSCVDFYIGTNIEKMRSYADNLDQYRIYKTTRELEYVDARILNDVENVAVDEPLQFELTVKRISSKIKQVQFGFVVNNSSEQTVGMYYSEKIDVPDKDIFKVRMSCAHHNLAKGKYSVNFNIAQFDYTAEVLNYDIVTNVLQFQISYLDAEHKKLFTLWPVRSDCLFRDVQVSTSVS